MQSDQERKRFFLRAANERIRLVNARFAVSDRSLRVFCECGRNECLQLVQIPADVYDEVRDSSRLFVARPGHEEPGRERIKENAQTYFVVKSHRRARRLPLPVAPGVGSVEDGVR